MTGVPRLTRHLVAEGHFRDAPLSLVDVGASGGIDGLWSVFGDDFMAVGFEPLRAEVERLNAESGNPSVRFENAFVSDHSHDGPPPARADTPVARQFSSVLWKRASYLLIKSYRDYLLEHFDPSGRGEMATRTVSLDDALREKPADFIKIDTDGHELPVLSGALESLRAKPVLGLSVEVQFHGPADNQANTFANIDTLLRREGFSLFHLQAWNYSRGALPRPFVYPLPAHTHHGQIAWGEALYFRDAGYEEYESIWDVALSAPGILKLACLFELFELQDCAAELLLKFRDALADRIDVQRCLDLLTPSSPLGETGYREYVKAFREQPERFFPPAAGPGASSGRLRDNLGNWIRRKVGRPR